MKSVDILKKIKICLSCNKASIMGNDSLLCYSCSIKILEEDLDYMIVCYNSKNDLKYFDSIIKDIKSILYYRRKLNEQKT